MVGIPPALNACAQDKSTLSLAPKAIALKSSSLWVVIWNPYTPGQALAWAPLGPMDPCDILAGAAEPDKCRDFTPLMSAQPPHSEHRSPPSETIPPTGYCNPVTAECTLSQKNTMQKRVCRSQQGQQPVTHMRCCAVGSQGVKTYKKVNLIISG